MGEKRGKREGRGKECDGTLADSIDVGKEACGTGVAADSRAVDEGEQDGPGHAGTAVRQAQRTVAAALHKALWGSIREIKERVGREGGKRN